MSRPVTERPSQQDADALVALPKYIRRMPRQRTRHGTVRLKTATIYDSAGRDTGVSIDAHMSAPPRGRGNSAQVALVWRNEPIRRIDWRLRHHNPDGEVVCGWHQHIWHDKHADQCAVAFKEPIAPKDDLEAIFRIACQHWNIHIRTRRDLMLR